jgi:hypothetical protein
LEIAPEKLQLFESLFQASFSDIETNPHLPLVIFLGSTTAKPQFRILYAKQTMLDMPVSELVSAFVGEKI